MGKHMDKAGNLIRLTFLVMESMLKYMILHKNTEF
jgi:hypothetical protein